MKINLKRIDFTTRWCNSDDEPIDGTEEEQTVIYNADLLPENKLNELIRSGWYIYDDRVIVVRKTQANYLFGNPVSEDICRECNDNKMNGGSCSHYSECTNEKNSGRLR